MHEARKYALRLSQGLICQDVCHQPFESGLIHFLAALGVNPDTLRLRTAPEYSSLLGSLVYYVRVLTVEAFLPSEQRSEQGAAKTLAQSNERDAEPAIIRQVRVAAYARQYSRQHVVVT
jgi:hypothetical protein